MSEQNLDELRTLDSVWNFFKEAMREKKPISPSEFLHGATILNLFLEDDENELVMAKSKLAEAKEEIYKQEGMTAVRVDNLIRTKDIWIETEKKEKKIKRIEEHIRILKKRSENPIWD